MSMLGLLDFRHDTVLVTGGAGYIGSHACKALCAVAYDNLVYGHECAGKWGPLEIGDILDRVRLGQVLAHYKPGAISVLSGEAALACVGAPYLAAWQGRRGGYP